MSDIDDAGKTVDLSTDGSLALPAVAPASAPADGTGTSIADVDEMLKSAFSGGSDTGATDAARDILRESPARVLAIAGEPVRTRKGRVAVLDWLGDDSSSMGDETTGQFPMLTHGYDMMIEMLRAEIAHDSVETLVTAGFLNEGPVYGYTRLADLPKMAGHRSRGGGTLWMKRFSEQLAALAVQVGRYEDMGREVTGVAFLGTDGWDTEGMALQYEYPTDWRDRLAKRYDDLRKMIQGYAAAGNISTAVAYMGQILRPGDLMYNAALNEIRETRESVGLSNPRSMDQEELIQDMFRAFGFPEDMIFLPGNDMRRLAEVLAAVSRSMVARSRGVKPVGNAGLSWGRH